MLVEGGFELAAIDHALQRDGGIDVYIPGRAERVSGEHGPAVYIDYGHTPDAFLNTLDALRRAHPGRVIMVFGADGDRDKTKRDDMGSIAARRRRRRGRDRLPSALRGPGGDPRRLSWRRPVAPCRTASSTRSRTRGPRCGTRCRWRHPGDSILYAGPGHEDYQEIAGVKHAVLGTRRRAAGAARGGLGHRVVIALDPRRDRRSRLGPTAPRPDPTRQPRRSSTAPSRPTPARSRPAAIFVAKPGEVDRRAPLRRGRGRRAARPLLIVERRARARRRRRSSSPTRSPRSAALATRRRRARARAGRLRIVGITGSNGKTTTKNLLARILERRGRDRRPARLVQQRGRRAR